MCASVSACARTHSYSQFARLCVQHRAPHKEDIVRICAVCILFPSPYLTLTLTIKKYKAICSLYHLYAELRRSVSFPLSFTESQSWRVCSIHSALARSHTITHTPSVHCRRFSFRFAVLYTLNTFLAQENCLIYTNTLYSVSLCSDLMKSFVARSFSFFFIIFFFFADYINTTFFLLLAKQITS